LWNWIGSVLSQRQEDGRPKPLSYASYSALFFVSACKGAVTCEKHEYKHPVIQCQAKKRSKFCGLRELLMALTFSGSAFTPT